MSGLKVFYATLLSSVALMLCASSPARAQATISDCEKIQAADAYNQCLAKFGPPAKTLNIEAPRPGDVKSGSEEAASGGGRTSAGTGRRHGRGRAVAHRSRGGNVGRASHGRSRGGRKRMSIPVGK